MKRIALILPILAVSWICTTDQAGAGDVVPNRFIITDEVYDFERFSSGSLAYRGWDFGIAIGEGVATQAKVVFADDPGRTLSQYIAEFGQVDCINNDYLVTADLASSITWNGPVILDLSGVLFEAVDFEAQDWRLRPDWQTRLNNYKNHAGGFYNANTTILISVFAEVTGTDLTNSEIGQAAARVKLLFPAGVKVAAGYPTGPGVEERLPASFPTELDAIVTWDYTIADPNAQPYYNSTTPQDPSTTYGKLVERLQGTQDIFFLVAGFNNGSVLGSASRVHQNTGVYFGTLLRRWCAFALKKHQGRNAGLIVWKYNDAYACTQGGSCNTSCPGVVRFITGANKTFAQEQAMGINGLARAYRAVSRAAAFGESCWTP